MDLRLTDVRLLVSDFVAAHTFYQDTLGRVYANELTRHFR